MVVHIGTSGWQYRDWRSTFYPDRTPVARWLETYAGGVATVESNNAFYRLPARRTLGACRGRFPPLRAKHRVLRVPRPRDFQGLAARTPADFVFAVKASRYLTH